MPLLRPLVLVGLLLGLIGFLILPIGSDGDTVVETAADPCTAPAAMVEAHEWAERNQDGLPRTLDAYKELSIFERRAAFQYLPPRVQGDLWKDHLTEVLDTRTGLNELQRTVVSKVIQRVGEMFASAEPQEIALELEQQIEVAFERDIAARVFGNIGPDPTAAELAELESATCVCHLDSLCSCFSSPWECTDDDCEQHDPLPGCGCFFLWSCTGRCGIGGPVVPVQ